MRSWREPLLWLVVGALGAGLLAFGYPRAFPLTPERWEVSRGEAEIIALERLRALGEPVQDAYVTVSLRSDSQLERRLQTGAPGVDPETLRSSLLGKMQAVWEVQVYRPRAIRGGWTYIAFVALDGEVLMLERVFPEAKEANETDETEARERALSFLRQQGFEAARFEPEPEIEKSKTGTRTDLTLRYRERAALLGAEAPYGLAVRFAGSELAGFGFWLEEPQREALEELFRQAQLITFGRVALFYLLLPFVAVPFLKRYHDGQLGVRRGVQLFLFFLGLGLIFVVLSGQQTSSGVGLGFATRQQTTWMTGLFVVVFSLLGLATLALASWSVGESLCRERWAQKLASIDAFFRLKWRNATFARSALRGLAAGLGTAGAMVVASVWLQGSGAWPSNQFIYGGALGTSLPGLALLAESAAFLLPSYLFASFFIPAWGARRLGPRWGLLLALAVAPFVLQPFLVILPLEWGLALWIPAVAVPILLFWFGDLLSALLAALTAMVTLGAMPLLHASDPWLELNGWAALAVLAVPLAVSLRQLGTDQEFVYLYDDVPPHVRRIAERERQRVELETARNIQSSILPELPPQLAGVEIAHAYLPASEVGGDFYDVLVLEDGRLALAVGDVAGHGVSSGLVMSMAKSALAVQVTFDPRVESVFKTLNRMVYQGARRRLLTTLCYALLDPARRELLYASAGHLFPYRVTPGRVEALESTAYPLGVRDQLEIHASLTRLEPGETLFFYSDGLVEAHPETSEEPFGFERLEASLARHAGKSPAELRDGVLRDVTAFVGHDWREDDMTVLVARLPVG